MGERIKRYLIGSGVPLVGDLYVWYAYEDVGLIKFFIGGIIPGPFVTDLIYFWGDGGQEDEEKDEGYDGSLEGQGERRRTGPGRYRDEKGRELMTSGGSGGGGGGSSTSRWHKLGGHARTASGYARSKAGHPWVKKGLKFSGVLLGSIIVLGLIGGLATSLLDGTGYGMLLNDMFGWIASELDFILPIEWIASTWTKIKATFLCFFTGTQAGCFREIVYLNSTQQPGSEDIGETYKLSVEGPVVSGTKDVRFRQPDSKIPVDFTVKNSRHGTKGINARDVKYKVKVADTGILNDKTACSTEWKNLNKFGDIEGSSSIDPDRNNLLLPGESASPLNYRGEDRLSLKQCGLMNVIGGEVFRVEVQLKYNYSALSFLQVDAKAHSEADQIERTRSKTPDTPVETFIRSDDPIVFDDRPGAGYQAIPTTLRLGINTDEDGSFRVNQEDFQLTDSNLTRRTGECDGLDKTGPDTFEFSDRIKERFKARQKEADEWFSSETGAPTASCNFELANPREISETGETVTMTTSVNYTYRSGEKATNFGMKNTACSRLNCPLIVPLRSGGSSEYALDDNIFTLDLEEESPIDYREATNWEKGDFWIKEHAKCNRPEDAQPGCTAVRNWSLAHRRELTGGTSENRTKIDFGDIAINMTGEYKKDHLVTDHVENLGEEAQGVIGVDLEDLEKAYNQQDTAFNYTESGEWELVGISP